MGCQISTECIAFLKTILRPAFHIKKTKKLIGLIKTSFWFTAVSPCGMEVGRVGCEFSASFSVSQMGALADLCLLCDCEKAPVSYMD